MSRKLEDLDPEFREKIGELLVAAQALGLAVVLVQGYRSSLEQELIYAKGRTRPGEPCRHTLPPRSRPVGTCKAHPFGATVTKAKPGQSWHEAGLAVDFAWKVGNSVSWDGPWEKLGTLAESLGLKWGGRWRSPDRPHVEMPHPQGIAFAIGQQEQRLA